MSVKKNPEMVSLKTWLPSFKKWNQQINSLNTSDAETFRVVKLNGKTNWATSVDSLNEEITWGLYQRPETIGWMAALQSLTDVAATGIRPRAVVLATTWKPHTSAAFKRKVMKAYFQSLQFHQVHFLGGDTTTGTDIQLTTTAFGWDQSCPLSRLGLRPGDLIVALGEHGSGPALGLRCVMGFPEKIFPESLFKPKPDLNQIIKLKPKLRCAIDVSDGIASSLCILSELNGVSFDIGWSEKFFNRASKEFCKKTKFPESALFFAEHGDYGFLVGISPQHFASLKKQYPNSKVIAAATKGKNPTRILNKDKIWKPIPLDAIFNAPKQTPKAVQASLKKWIKISKKLNLP